jgi:hypothetical protein
MPRSGPVVSRGKIGPLRQVAVFELEFQVTTPSCAPNGPLTLKLPFVTLSGAEPEVNFTWTFGFCDTHVLPSAGEADSTAEGKG